MKKETSFPPKWADQFLTWFVDENLIEEIQGDLHEAYFFRAEKYGRKAADRQFISDVFKFFKPYAFEKYSRVKQFLPMYNNYFKIAFRNIMHRKGFTAINIIGLTIGITAVMLIGIYLKNEWSYDHSTPDHERIHRVMNKFRDQTYTCMPFNGYDGPSADTQHILVDLLTRFDEVETACHFVPSNSAIGGNEKYFLETDGKRFTIENALYTNTGKTFQRIFPQYFLAGTPEFAFSTFNKIVLTEELTERVFGKNWNAQNIIGKGLTIRGETFELGGVIANVPGNVHYDFDFILHQDRIPESGAYTYVKLNPENNIGSVLEKLNNDVAAFHPHFLTNDLFKGIVSVPLTDIHFTPNTLYELKPVANKSYLATFGIVGLVILLIIWANYTNLSIAMYADRQKELGMRKVMGARSQDISLQLLAEAVLVSMLCFPLVLLLLQYILPQFNGLMGMELNNGILIKSFTLIGLFGLLLFTGILSGTYPAMVYGGRSMLRLFGKTISISTSNRHFNFRNALLTFQFVMVVGLLSMTYFIFQQMEYINQVDIGYNKEGVIYFNIDGAEKYELLKNKLVEIPEVEAVGANGVPGPMMFNQMTYKMKGSDVTFSDGTSQYYSLGTIEALNIKCEACELLKNGKERIYVINRTAAEKLAKTRGLEPEALIGETVVEEPEYENEEYGYGIHRTIDGIIDDYKYFSLKHPNQPMMISILNKPTYVYEMLVRANTDDWYSTTKKIEAAYSEVETTRPLELLFLDDRLASHYKDEQRSTVLLSGLSLVAVILSLMGLAGIVSYVAFSRQKEIGVRKVLGATVSDILLRFIREYMMLMVIATAFASPIALYFADKWLEGFAFRIEPQFWVVVLAGLSALFIVSIVVTIQARRAAIKHPVETLRTE